MDFEFHCLVQQSKFEDLYENWYTHPLGLLILLITHHWLELWCLLSQALYIQILGRHLQWSWHQRFMHVKIWDDECKGCALVTVWTNLCTRNSGPEWITSFTRDYWATSWWHTLCAKWFFSAWLHQVIPGPVERGSNHVLLFELAAWTGSTDKQLPTIRGGGRFLSCMQCTNDYKINIHSDDDWVDCCTISSTILSGSTREQD